MPGKDNAPGSRLIQAENTTAGGGFATPALPHQAERLMFLYLKTNFIYGFNISQPYAAAALW